MVPLAQRSPYGPLPAPASLRAAPTPPGNREGECVPVSNPHSALRTPHSSDARAFRLVRPDLRVQVGLDEGVDLAIKDGLDVASLRVGAGVLHQRVGVQDIGADLAAELGGHPLALQPRALLL